MSGKGLLLAMMEPSEGFDEEFHDWYDTEHVPERVVVPGFETAQRFVCLSGFPRYVAFYDLAGLDVLQSPAYLYANTGGAGPTSGAPTRRHSPWTMRVRARTRGRYRFTGTQIHPGEALHGQNGAPIRLAILRFRSTTAADEPGIVAGLEANFGGRPDLLQMRLFRGEDSDGRDCVAILEFRSALTTLDVDAAPFGAIAQRLDAINIYAPYWRSVYNAFFNAPGESK